MLARYSRTFIGFDIVKKIARKYPHANEHKVSLMLKDLGVLDYNKDGVNYDWDRVSELIEMIDSEFD